MDFNFKLFTLRTRLMNVIAAVRKADVERDNVHLQNLLAIADAWCMVADRRFVADYNRARDYVTGHPFNPAHVGLRDATLYFTGIDKGGVAPVPAITLGYDWEGTDLAPSWSHRETVPIAQFQDAVDHLFARIVQDRTMTREACPPARWTIANLPDELASAGWDLMRELPSKLANDNRHPLGQACRLMSNAAEWLRDVQRLEKQAVRSSASLQALMHGEAEPTLTRRDTGNVRLEQCRIHTLHRNEMDTGAWHIQPADPMMVGRVDVTIALKGVAIELLDTVVAGYHELLDNLLRAQTLKVELPAPYTAEELKA